MEMLGRGVICEVIMGWGGHGVALTTAEKMEGLGHRG